MQPIAIQKPSIFQKLRSRLGIRTGIGRSAELEYTIQPVVQVDPLLLESRAGTWSFTVAGNGTTPLVTVPAGEVWHLKFMDRWEDGAADFYLRILIVRPDQDDPTTTYSFIISPATPDSTAVVVIDVRDIIMRQGDQLEAIVGNYISGTVTNMALLYDLEDCGS